MKIKFLVVLLCLVGFLLTGCNLPFGAQEPTPEPVFSARRPPVTPLASLGQATLVPTIAPTVSFLRTPNATPDGITKYNVDPAGSTATDPEAGVPLRPGTKYTLVYPGKSKAGIGVWFWTAKQYGSVIPPADMLVNTSKYSQAYIYWLSEPSDPEAKFDWEAYGSDLEVKFVFYLPQ